MTAPPLLSIVIPAFNEEGVIAGTLHRISDVVATHPALAGRTEVVVVSDGSSDATFRESAEALAATAGGTAVQLVRNVGSHSAIRCGLRYATGDHVAVMSADGQDPPEALPAMLEAMGPGVDVVWGRRESRRRDPLVRRTLARAYYGLFRRITGLDFPPAGLDFFVMTRRVAEALLRYRERNLSLFLLAYNLGFGQVEVPYVRGERAGGTSGWTLRKRLKLAVDMLTAFSAAPIRLVSFLGIVVGVLGIGFGGFTLVRGLIGNTPVEGWASLMVITSTLGGLMLIGLALVGEYIWRALDEVRDRPLYLEAERVTVESTHVSGD